MNLAPVLAQRFFDANGNPLAGGLLYTYAAGTTTPQATYSSAGGTANTNPVVLDGNGYADVWLDPTLAYKFVLKDASGASIRSVDQVTSAASGSDSLLWNANTVYTQGSIVADSSGQGLLYVSLISSNQNNTLTNASAWRVLNGNVRSVSANTALAVTDDVVRSNSTSGSVTHTLPTASTTPIGKKITVVEIGTGGNTTACNSVTLSNGTAATFQNNGASWDDVNDFGIPDGTITTAKIANAAVTSAKLGTRVVTAGNIADATITGAQIASGVNLAGVPQANGLDIVVAGDNTHGALKIIRGRVDGTSGGVSAGEGWTNAGITGSFQYNINFTTAFASEPIVIAVPYNNAAAICTVLAASSTGAAITPFNLSGVGVQVNFDFIAIGPR